MCFVFLLFCAIRSDALRTLQASFNDQRTEHQQTIKVKAVSDELLNDKKIMNSRSFLTTRCMHLQTFKPMTLLVALVFLGCWISSDQSNKRTNVHAFVQLSSSVTTNQHSQLRVRNLAFAKLKNIHENLDEYTASSMSSERRRYLFTSAVMTSLSTLLLQSEPSYADIEGVVTPSFLNDPEVSAKISTDSEDTLSDKEGVTLYTTKSGLKYIELREGTGPSPKYGNFVSISYKGYIKLPGGKSTNSKLQEYDSDPSYLIKHGNGRIIPGLDEGLHTMKVGGKRRIIIPPKLGYVGPGVLGPIPEGPIGRFKLNKLLDEMIEVRGGNVVFDVELRSVVEDEADQGYYEDQSLTPEQFNTLRTNLQQKAKAARTGFDLLDSI